MRGKKADPDFLSNFIVKCVQQDYTTPEDMVKIARSEIKNIDDKIREVEQLKIVRSKLLDIITTFEISNNSKAEESKLIPLFTLAYPHLCKDICDILKQGPIFMNFVKNNQLHNDIKFCLKQLLACKVVARVGDQIVQGERFEDYIQIILRDK